MVLFPDARAVLAERKHGGSCRARIEIQVRDHSVRLTVVDNGDGLDPCAKSDGYGLHIMRERAELLGGTLTIDSAPGRGTRITTTSRRAGRAAGKHRRILERDASAKIP